MIFRIAYAVSEWLFNPRCPLCRDRTRNLEGHYAVDHAGDAVP